MLFTNRLTIKQSQKRYINFMEDIAIWDWGQSLDQIKSINTKIDALLHLKHEDSLVRGFCIGIIKGEFIVRWGTPDDPVRQDRWKVKDEQ